MENTRLLATYAQSAWEQLEKLGKEVDLNIINFKLPSGDPIFTAGKNGLEAVILGFRITISKKVISIEGSIESLEYSFIHPKGEDEIIMSNLYLDVHGNIYEDHELEKVYCDYDNKNLTKFIYEKLTVALTESDLTKPSSLN